MARLIPLASAALLCVSALAGMFTPSIADAKSDKEQPKNTTVDLASGLRMAFVLIEKGSFKMGSPAEEKGRNPYKVSFDVEQQHEVEITKPFYMAKYPVTQEQYRTITLGSPSNFSDTGIFKKQVQGLDTSKFPVENVSWDDAQAFCKQMRESDKQGRKFRLPTEAEWEFACRAGAKTAYFFGDDAKNLGDYAWIEKNSEGRMHEVGTRKPNPWGLCDMHGNVWQWCEDYYGLYEGLPKRDPVRSVKSGEGLHVIRGGGPGVEVERCRAACRSTLATPNDRSSIVGFRIAYGVE